MSTIRAAAAAMLGALGCAAALAAPAQPPGLVPGQGKLLLTGGVSSIDGAAGGGLTPWALTAGYASRGEFGGTAHATRVRTQDYALSAFGAAVAIDERIELSLARQDFDAGAAGGPLGLPGLRLKQDILAAKWRFAGDAVLDSDSWMPQLAVGLQRKVLDAAGLAGTLDSLGAARRGTDVYLSATKLFLAPGLIVNLTLRATNANQNGLLGFGGTARQARSLQPELSLAWLLRRDLAIGAEWRRKPDNLNPSPLGGALQEDDWADVFVAWAPNKLLSLTAAWVDLGHIVPGVVPTRQTGTYLSVQLAF